MSTPILKIENLNFSYGLRKILDNVNFFLDENDFVAIIGPNGGGKSTLVKLIMGLIQPSSGTISLFGGTPESGRRQVGYLAQFRQVDIDFPIRVIDTVLMSRLVDGPTRRYKPKDIEDAHEALENVGIRDLSARTLSELSGGQKQRVFLARAILNTPKLLILDEPTTSVDSPTGLDFYDLLKNLKQKMSILMVSHDISAVSKTVDKIACLNRTLIYHGTKELGKEDLEHTYGCAVELIAHGIPHRVLGDHSHG